MTKKTTEIVLKSGKSFVFDFDKCSPYDERMVCTMTIIEGKALSTYIFQNEAIEYVINHEELD